MKFVVYHNRWYNNLEKIRIYNIIIPCGEIVDKADDNLDNIYIKHNEIIYKFNRYDNNFIEKVQEAIDTNSYSHCPGISYEGPLIILEENYRKFIIKRTKNLEGTEGIEYESYESIIEEKNKIIEKLENKILLLNKYI